MRFSQDFIEKVRDANNIVDVLSEHTQLKRTGNRLMGLCPFPGHNEKTPSFSVSEDKQVYHCFGCHRAGQIFTAVQELKGYTFPETVEFLAQRAGISLPADGFQSAAHIEQKSHREKLLNINLAAANYYSAQLQKSSSSQNAKNYCAKRALSPEMIELFHLGYASSLWEGLSQHLTQLKLPLPLAAELGLVRLRKDGSGYFDLFRDRLMFPIYSQKGECVGFGGRALSHEQTPKYLNSPESELFSKGNIFYGLNESAKYIRASGGVIIVEGYMDYLALFSVGIKNVVATLGTALTPAHAKLLKRYTANIIVLYDGDSAGQTAAIRSLPILLAEGLLPKAVVLPNDLDPDDFIKMNGADELNKLVASAADLYSVVFDKYLVNYKGSASEKVRIIEKLTPIINGVADPLLKDLYLNETCQKLGIELNWLQKHLQAASYHAKGAENRPVITPQMPNDVIEMGSKINLKGAPRSELFLLNISLMNEERFNAIWSSGICAEVSHPGLQELFLKAEGYYRQIPSEFAKLSVCLMELAEPPQLLSLSLNEPLCALSGNELEKFTEDCIRQIREKHLRNQTREIAASIRVGKIEDQQEKLEQIMNIQKSKQMLRRDRET